MKYKKERNEMRKKKQREKIFFLGKFTDIIYLCISEVFQAKIIWHTCWATKKLVESFWLPFKGFKNVDFIHWKKKYNFSLWLSVLRGEVEVYILNFISSKIIYKENSLFAQNNNQPWKPTKLYKKIVASKHCPNLFVWRLL